MKKNRFVLIVPIIASLLFSSCSKELTDANINPNSLEKADATTMLSNTIVSEFYHNANIAWTLGNGYNQYMTFSQSYYNQATRYSPVTNEPYWTAMYEAARDANTLNDLGQSQSNPFLQAVALTLRSYAFAQLTELWGDIPFSDALQGASGTYTPKYDTQETVYTDANAGILASLAKADELLKTSSNGEISGDLLFNSDVTSWRKFVNALRLRYLLRISSKKDVSAEMTAIVNDGTLMDDASQSAAIQLPTSIPYNFVSLSERSGDFAVKYMNSLLYDTFKATGDTARVSDYFAVTVNASSGSAFSFDNYGGMPIVVDATSTQAAAASNFNASFTSGSNSFLTKARIMTYAEQEFILAEAALKGYIPGDAATYYNKGVMGAYAEIGLDAATASNYLMHDGVKFDSSSSDVSLKQIITQKWLANIDNGFEGWIEYQRTGYPALETGGSANMNNGNIATRFLYPTTESTINTTNYNDEIQNMGGKEITTYKAWWQK